MVCDGYTKAMTLMLNKIGINVNQIAKAANQSALSHQDAVYIAQAAMMIKKIVYGVNRYVNN